ncbi:hypothetical protein BH11PLA2_BH11PLA2_47810 [soil metagenome]
MLRSLLLLTLIAFPAMADDKEDLKALAGTWTIEKFVYEGADLTGTFKDATLVLDGTTYTLTNGKDVDKGTFVIDSSKTPKWMDLTGTEGPSKDKKFFCIYEVKDGVMSVCYNLDEKGRPAKLETAKDSKTMVITYKKK